VAEAARYWSWRVEGAGPPLTLALASGEALRAAAVQAATRQGLDRMPDELHSSGAEGGHRHAYWLSEDRDRDGVIDHMTLFAAAGIAPAFADILRRIGELRLPAEVRRHWPAASVLLSQAEAGVRGKQGGLGLFGPARVWVAATPFVTRLWRHTKTGKPRAAFTPTEQVAGEIRALEDGARKRRLPEPAAIGWLRGIALGGTVAGPSNFLLATLRMQPNGDAFAGFPVVAFATPVDGPIALGYGAHFGLGLMLPADAEANSVSTAAR
jgi:CRISPR-associated protein Csb2